MQAPYGIRTPVEITEGRIDDLPVIALVNEKITEMYGWTAETLKAPVPDNDYGRIWKKSTPQYFKEATMYRLKPPEERFNHMVNMIKLDLPFFEFESRGYINSNALRVIKANCERDDLGVAGAASTGKTFPVGAWVLEDWKSAPDVTLAFVCTTSLAASEDRIWGAVVKMWQKSTYKIGTYVPHKHVIAFGNFSESAQDRDFNSAIKALAIEKGEEGRKAIEVMRGRKQHNVTLVYDELPEMETYVTQGAINLESNAAVPEINAFGLRVRGIGNPHRHEDAHGQMCRPDHPLGYKSIDKDTPEWKTRTGWCIFLNGEWSPNFEAPIGAPIPFPRLTNRVSLAGMLNRCHGNANSIEYWRNAIGFWPNSSVTQTVLTEELILKHGADKKAEWGTRTRTKLAAFDAGFTAGGDKCVCQFGEIARDLTGVTILEWQKETVYMPEVGDNFEDSIAEQIVPDLIEAGVQPECFGMDISGDGGKMLQAIIRRWILVNKNAVNIVAISSMGTATERIVSNLDPRKCKDVFDRRVTEYWMMTRNAVLCEVIKNIPIFVNGQTETHAIVDQLCTRTYEILGKKFSIETKKKYKETKQKPSPDNADSFVYLVEMGRRNGLVFETKGDKKRGEERRKEQKEQMVAVKAGDYPSDDWGEKED